MGMHDHKAAAPRRVRVGVITVTSSRTAAEDKSGAWICKRARKEGHVIAAYALVGDQAADIRRTLQEMIAEHRPQIVLVNGGTGVSPRDVTIEALRPLFRKELTAFAPLFAQLSFEEIDSAALLSRATAGVVGRTAVFCMPGSQKACRLACKDLIFPELGHLVKHLDEG